MFELIKFKYDETFKISNYLKPFTTLRDYKYFFSSKEWILSYLNTYKPEENYFILFNKSKTSNYFVLERKGHILKFLGYPLNDFNGFYNLDVNVEIDIDKMLKFLKKESSAIYLDNLFEHSLYNDLSRHASKISQTISLRIFPKDGIHFCDLISNRVKKMFEKNHHLTFGRAFPYSKDVDNNFLLTMLLELRQKKLFQKKSKFKNPSFDDKFKNLIREVYLNKTLNQNIYIDYCSSEKDILAMSLNILHSQNSLCYLRCHKNLGNQISIGLVLDYWSSRMNEINGLKLLDLARGDESYKYRLGASEYKLKNYHF